MQEVCKGFLRTVSKGKRRRSIAACMVILLCADITGLWQGAETAHSTHGGQCGIYCQASKMRGFVDLAADDTWLPSLMAVCYALQEQQDNKRGFGCLRLPSTVYFGSIQCFGGDMGFLAAGGHVSGWLSGTRSGTHFFGPARGRIDRHVAGCRSISGHTLYSRSGGRWAQGVAGRVAKHTMVLGCRLFGSVVQSLHRLGHAALHVGRG